MVTDDIGDMEYIFPGSDDDFDAEDLQEEYGILDREQSALDLEDICNDARLQSVGSQLEFLVKA